MERQDRWGDAFAVVGPDPSTFTTPWISNKLAHGFPVSHGPSLDSDGMGYFGDWVDNRVYKFNYSTGTILGSFLTTSFTESVPAIAGGIIVCGADQFLFGVDTSIMDYDWFKSNFGYTGGSAVMGPDGNAVIAGSAGGTAYKLNPTTGVPLWTRSGLGTPHGSMVFTRDDSSVICANGNAVTAMDYGTGAIVWRVTFPAAMYSPATAKNGTIIVGSDNGTVYDLSPADGSTVWTWTTVGQVEGAAAFSPDGTVAYVPSFDYRIYALRVADGVRLWSYTTSLWCQTPPSVGIDGRIYEHNKAGDLYCISPAGTLIWQVHLNGESRGPMTIGPDGSLYVGYTGNNDAGLAIIRLQAIDLEPDSFTIDHGNLVSGGLSDVFFSDNNYLVVDQTPTITPLTSPVRVIFTAHPGYFPLTQIKLTVQAHASLNGLTRYTELWNNSTNRWDVVASASEGTSDTTAVITVNNAQPYTDGAGQVKERVRWTPSGFILAPNWSTSINYIHFDAVPLFQS